MNRNHFIEQVISCMALITMIFIALISCELNSGLSDDGGNIPTSENNFEINTATDEDEGALTSDKSSAPSGEINIRDEIKSMGRYEISIDYPELQLNARLLFFTDRDGKSVICTFDLDNRIDVRDGQVKTFITNMKVVDPITPNLEDFSKIKKGMHIFEVVDLIGIPTSADYNKTGSTSDGMIVYELNDGTKIILDRISRQKEWLLESVKIEHTNGNSEQLTLESQTVPEISELYRDTLTEGMAWSEVYAILQNANYYNGFCCFVDSDGKAVIAIFEQKETDNKYYEKAFFFSECLVFDNVPTPSSDVFKRIEEGTSFLDVMKLIGLPCVSPVATPLGDYRYITSDGKEVVIVWGASDDKKVFRSLYWS